MQLHLFPILFALFVWWFTTGVIIYLDGLPRRTFKWSFLGASLLTIVSLWGLYATRNDTSVWGAYLAFTWGTLAWGWQEIASTWAMSPARAARPARKDAAGCGTSATPCRPVCITNWRWWSRRCWCWR